MSRPDPASSLLLAVVAVAVLVAGCGDDEGPTEAAERAGAHPFTVDVEAVPADFELVALGSGTDTPEWDAEMGSDEPLTVVDVDGTEVHARMVAWEPMEGELKFASRSGDTSPEELMLDEGRAAAHGEGTDGGWDDLVIEVDDTVALVIAAQGATREELTGYAEHLRSDGDPTEAPEVHEPPDGWVEVGSVGLDALVAMRSEPYERSGAVPGPAGAYGMGWVDRTPPAQYEDPGALTLAVLPAAAADLDAIERSSRRSWEPVEEPVRVEVDGRAGVVVETPRRFGGIQRSLATHDRDGALVILNATGGTFPTVDELVRLASSVRRVDDAAWQAAIVEAFGGPGLAPDEGESEIARGEVDGIGWLLQTVHGVRPTGMVGLVDQDTQGELPAVSVQVDPCLKLSTLQRVCPIPAGGRGGTLAVWDEHGESAAVDFPSFTLVVTPVAAATVRATAGGQVVDATLHPVPGGEWDHAYAGVLFGQRPPGAFPSCRSDPPEPPPGSNLSTRRIDLLDPAGAPVGCIATM